MRRKFFPTERQKMVEKWYAENGDDKYRLDYELDQDSLVFDLGGYKGQWASDLFSRYLCRIIIFEPVGVFAERINRRFLKNDKIKVHQLGLGGAARKEQICLCEDGSSIYKDKGEFETIQIVDVFEWFEQEKIKSVQLMKINIEGGEYELLERLVETGLISIIENIQVQFHRISNDSAHRMEDIQAKLMETHKSTYQYRFVWENWTRK